MKRLLLIVIVLSLVTPVAAQEGFEPFTNEALSIQGIVPTGWTPSENGIWMRDASDSDVVFIAQQSLAANASDTMQALLPQFSLTEAPESVGTFDGELTWTLYQFDVQDGPAITSPVGTRISMGLAEVGNRTLLGALRSLPEDHDALYTSIFEPMLMALRPLDAPEVPYIVEEITFTNGDLTLAGTLTLPDTAGAHPAVVLMTGSGPQTRDNVLVPGFPLFERIADYLTRQGLAVLRYDDRGFGASDGDYSAATIFDLTSDAAAAIDYLASRDDVSEIGVLGHSEGAIYASILGAERDLPFIISMAGPSADMGDVLVLQNQVILEHLDVPQRLIDTQILAIETARLYVDDVDSMQPAMEEAILELWADVTEDELAEFGITDLETFANELATQLQASFDEQSLVSALNFTPPWDAVEEPLLVLLGEKDVQVILEQNQPAFEEALTNHPDATIVVVDDANHLFQAADTGQLAEYTELETDFAPDFLSTIGDWILERVTVN